MAQLEVTRVTRSELDNGIIPANYVLCHQFFESEGAKTKAGIIYGILTDLTYQDSENLKDDSSHIADMAETALIVYKLPDRLYFDPDDNKSMPWDTEMELEVGDMIFTNPIDALNAVTLECEGEYYKLLPYEELYVAKREYWLSKFDGKKATKVIPLNGYVLLEPVYFETLSPLDVTSAERVNKTQGIVRFIGSCNKRYRQEDQTDLQDLKEGDVVQFEKKGVPWLLERTKYNNFFSEKGELFWVIQRRKIAMVIERK